MTCHRTTSCQNLTASQSIWHFWAFLVSSLKLHSSYPPFACLFWVFSPSGLPCPFLHLWITFVVYFTFFISRISILFSSKKNTPYFSLLTSLQIDSSSLWSWLLSAAAFQNFYLANMLLSGIPKMQLFPRLTLASSLDFLFSFSWFCHFLSPRQENLVIFDSLFSFTAICYIKSNIISQIVREETRAQTGRLSPAQGGSPSWLLVTLLCEPKSDTRAHTLSHCAVLQGEILWDVSNGCEVHKEYEWWCYSVIELSFARWNIL